MKAIEWLHAQQHCTEPRLLLQLARDAPPQLAAPPLLPDALPVQGFLPSMPEAGALPDPASLLGHSWPSLPVATPPGLPPGAACRSVGSLTSCVAHGTSAVSLDQTGNTLQLEGGQRVPFQTCILAPGSHLSLPLVHSSLVSPDAAHLVLSSREEQHLQAVRQELSRPDAHVTVLGGEWDAIALATSLSHPALRRRRRSRAAVEARSGTPTNPSGPGRHLPAGDGASGAQVLLLMGGSGPLASVCPKYLQQQVAKHLYRAGVDCAPYTSLQYASLAEVAGSGAGRHGSGSRRRRRLDGGAMLELHTSTTYDSLRTTTYGTDVLLLAPTRLPAATHILSGGGQHSLEVDCQAGGIAVNAELAGGSGIFVAGDAASLPHHLVGRHRSQALSGAVLTGLVAGLNAAGGRLRYSHLPAEQHTLPGLGVTATCVGQVDAALESYGLWLPGEKWGKDGQSAALPRGVWRNKAAFGGLHHGLVFYVKDGRVVGGMLWHARRPEALGNLPSRSRLQPPSTQPAAVQAIRRLIRNTAKEPLVHDEDLAALLRVAAESVLCAGWHGGGVPASRVQPAPPPGGPEERQAHSSSIPNLTSRLASRNQPRPVSASPQYDAASAAWGGAAPSATRPSLTLRWQAATNSKTPHGAAATDLGVEDILPVARYKARGGSVVPSSRGVVRAGGVSLAAGGGAAPPACAFIPHPGTHSGQDPEGAARGRRLAQAARGRRQRSEPRGNADAHAVLAVARAQTRPGAPLPGSGRQ